MVKTGIRNADISREEKISLKAGELVGKLYDALFKEYIEPDENSFRSLNILCVRIVFCLYAEDAGLFETRTAFEDYIKSFSTENLRDGIIKLFKTLNTKPENRDKYETKINSFPYVNGGLFADDAIEIPNFTKEIVDVIVNHCAPFDWSEISPTIFGAVFESTLNPETRRKGGMHYTSIKNIHKVIDPLFLDDLKADFEKIVGTRAACPQKNAREPRALRQKLEQFRNKLASLTFLDPACGSGNFLTETYISLRRLENECLKVVHGSQMLLSSSDFSPIKVKISQFYGIEINDFAVTVAKTALWIAESQMMKETEEIVEQNLDFLPLSTSATIVEGNALRMDWSTLSAEKSDTFVYADRLNVYKIDEKFGMMSVHEPTIPYNAHYTELNVVTPEITERKFPEKDIKTSVTYDYIIGNPPFVGFNFMSVEQKRDLNSIFTGVKNLDYVCCWYKKAVDFIQGKRTRCAFVSTNSITQGETVARFFPFLKVQYDFAWRTFKWVNETSDKKNMAAVHCVIIGFSSSHSGRSIESASKNRDVSPVAQRDKFIFDETGIRIKAENINPYLIDAPNIIVASRNRPLCNVPQMVYGNKPADGGYLIIEEDEYEDFIRKDPASAKFVRPMLGAVEFLYGKKRWCLWLENATPAEIKKSPLIYDRVKKCQAARENSVAAGIRKFADIPHLFAQRTQPCGADYIIVPSVSSEKRKYVPIGFMDGDTIASNLVFVIPKATLYHFGILTSCVHNAWMRAVCGRLESRYRYSKDVVYNNFPWCNPTETQKNKIEQTARAILDAREKYPDSSLADLYDETLMPPELRKAHKENDKAVMAAYGFNPKMTEAEIVAELFKMYEKLTAKV
ncbi:class I SAM-dependent DNA methyltransferase [bacterium]|nr:class I SAM-dependent DNA methyltransferase [bacterium]